MSHIHLTETEEYRQRVIQLGENPDRVINTGAIGVYNIIHAKYLSREQLEAELMTTIPEKSPLATFHPATLDSIPPKEQCENLLAALDKFPDYKVIFTYPNNDTSGKVIIDLIENYAAGASREMHCIPVFRIIALPFGVTLCYYRYRQFIKRYC